MGVYIWPQRLPDTYQEVEYIQSSGTQYINTWFIVNNNSKVEFKVSWWNDTGSNTLIGSDYDWANKWFWIVSKWYQFWTSWAETWYLLADGNEHTWELSQNWFYVDWVLKYTPSTQTFTWYASYIFANNRRWTTEEYVTAKIHYVKYYDNWTLVRNLIPCYRKSDSVIWLYDLINNTFYTNQWSWTFTKGSDVSNKLKNAYIGEYREWSPSSNTVAYFPLKNDSLDVMWNWTLSNAGAKDWLGYKFTSSSTVSSPSWTVRYINYWICINAYPTGNRSICAVDNPAMWYYAYQGASNLRKKIYVFTDSSFNSATVDFAPTTWTWHNVSYGYDGEKTIYSIDGVTGTLYNWIGHNFWATFYMSQWANITLSEVIVEDTCWDSSKISKYYDQTKWDYWIS